MLLGPVLSAKEFSANVSLVLNIGSGSFRTSPIRQRLLRNDHDRAADIWWRWRRGGSDRRILLGFVKRGAIKRESLAAAETLYHFCALIRTNTTAKSDTNLPNLLFLIN